MNTCSVHNPDEEQLELIEAGVRDLEASTMVDKEYCIELVRIDRDVDDRSDYVWVRDTNR